MGIKLNHIYCEDAFDTIDRMPNNFLDLTVTSPPYNVDLGNNKYKKDSYDLYKDNKPYIKYIAWLNELFYEIYLKTKSGGRCAINIGDAQNGKITTHSDIIQFMKKIGWKPMSAIIWDKKDTSNRAAWGSWMSPSCPSFPKPFEYILIFTKNSNKLQTNGMTDLTRDEFIKYANGMWNFPGIKSDDHPAPFPLELPLRCIKMLSWIDSIIYDPFMGIGTTARACVQTRRNYIGSEISQNYVDIANRYIKNERPSLFYLKY